MMGTTKLELAASPNPVLAPVVTVGVVAPGILIGGVLLLILGCGPPI